MKGFGAFVTTVLVGAAVIGGGATTPVFAQEPTLPPSTSVELTGSIAQLSDAPVTASPIKLFRVTGQGYLSVDFSAVGSAGPAESKLRVSVPEGVDVGSSAASAASALREYTLETGNPVLAQALTAVGAGPRVAALVNITPAATAVHKIYAVLATSAGDPRTAIDPSQSPTNVQADVTNADTYWRAQSGNRVGFTLAGVSSWYKSAYQCWYYEPDNFANIIAEAAEVAETELGYRDLPNNHLVVVFPSGTFCPQGAGNAAGASTIGSSLNSGGVMWVTGTGGNVADGSNALVERGNLIHHLGHNLSLGHGGLALCDFSGLQDWQRYSYLFQNNCPASPSGDLADGMSGAGLSGYAPGSLSSPEAIRSGLWTSTAYSSAPRGQSTYVLNSVSTNAGRRAVLVESQGGATFFVEFRSGSGNDAPYAGVGCQAEGAYVGGTQCGLGQPGVRVLRAGTFDNAANYKGFPGAGSEVIATKVGDAYKTNYTAGQTFKIADVSVKVTAINGNTATIVVTLPTWEAAGLNYVRIWCTLCEAAGSPNPDSRIVDTHEYHVGDTLTAMMSGLNYGYDIRFQWFRDNAPIAGATQQNYTLTAADLNKRMKVTLRSFLSPGYYADPSFVVADPELNSGLIGYGPVQPGTIVEGTVGIDATTLPFTASMSDWVTPGLTFQYYWLRDGWPIWRANGPSYTPTQFDNGAEISLLVWAKKPGYTDTIVLSDFKDYTLASTGRLQITGVPQVGQELSLNSLSYSTTDGAVSPTVTYKWYRTGVQIPGAVGSTYQPTTADIGKVISAKAFARLTGFAGNTATAGSTGFVVPAAAPLVSRPSVEPQTPSIVAPTPTSEFVTRSYRNGVAVAV